MTEHCDECQGTGVVQCKDCIVCGSHASSASACWFCMPFKERGWIFLLECPECGEERSIDNSIVAEQYRVRALLHERYGSAAPRPVKKFWEQAGEAEDKTQGRPGTLTPIPGRRVR